MCQDVLQKLYYINSAPYWHVFVVQSVSQAADWRRVKITTLFCYVRKHFQAARCLSLFASKRLKENHKSSTGIMNTVGLPCLN